MLTKMQENNIISKLNERKIDKNVQGYILDYCDANLSLFSDICSLDEILDKLSTNVKKLEYSNLTVKNMGIFFGKEGTVRIDSKLRNDTTGALKAVVLHQLDSAFVYDKEKNTCGIVLDGKNEGLNDGISSVKQQKYEEYFGLPQNLPSKYEKDFNEDLYHPNLKVATKVANIVGLETLIDSQKSNDYQKLKNEFSKNTSSHVNLDDISASSDLLHPALAKTKDDIKKANKDISSNLKIAFIAKRCNDLGIDFDEHYYENLPKEKLNLELEKLDAFTNNTNSLGKKDIKPDFKNELSKYIVADDEYTTKGYDENEEVKEKDINKVK